MKYTLKQLAVFESVATLGSVSNAADHLSLTQSATSMSLSQLEKMLGRPLFERQGKRMVLTQWGTWLRPKAKSLLFDAQQIELGFYDQHVISGEVRLGCSQTAAEHLVPDLISKIDTDFPELRLAVKIKNTQKVIDGVLDYTYDMGIIEGRCDDSRIQQETWCNDHLVIVCSSSHPYAKLDNVSATQLMQAKWVLREDGAGTRKAFDYAIQNLVDQLCVYREYEHVPILRTLVAKGTYLSCLPYLDVIREVEAGTLSILPVSKLKIERRLIFIWRKDSGFNPLNECIRSEAKIMAREISKDM
ncbi:LysR substrate-binding domain-containing protein [Aliivibrio kagoshimensis]|uniref:LysR substrate-binding domain-containing protein n=1 Tax=Aliivibrio kagoshimensis TaxID=2910230 RepID=UPI003D0F0E25